MKTGNTRVTKYILLLVAILCTTTARAQDDDANSWEEKLSQAEAALIEDRENLSPEHRQLLERDLSRVRRAWNKYQKQLDEAGIKQSGYLSDEGRANVAAVAAPVVGGAVLLIIAAIITSLPVPGLPNDVQYPPGLPDAQKELDKALRRLSESIERILREISPAAEAEGTEPCIPLGGVDGPGRFREGTIPGVWITCEYLCGQERVRKKFDPGNEAKCWDQSLVPTY